MTRINLVPVQELNDQHLFAEFREIKMVPKSLNRSLLAAQARYSYGFTPERAGELAEQAVLKSIPSAFTLGKGHVSFFYDKGGYLAQRFEELRVELRKRGVQFNEHSLFDDCFHMVRAPWNGEYTPTPEALAIIRARIADRIALKPHWYRTTVTE